MGTTFAITVLTGPHRNRRFSFQGPVRCTVGRASDCLVRFSGDDSDLTISRHHCRLDIDLPCVYLKDLGSLNGTYLNGMKLEPAREIHAAAGDMVAAGESVVPVKDGDVIRVGDTAFRIDLVEYPLAAEMELGVDTPEFSVAKHECAAVC